MPRPIFPPEILHNTVEIYHTQIHTRSKSIYWLILCMLAGVFAALFTVRVDVTSQSRGVTRTPFENTAIQTMVYGEIVAYNMAENKTVHIGDTLLLLNADKLNEQISLLQQKTADNLRFISDLNSLINNRPEAIVSPKYRNERRRTQAKTNELQIAADYLQKDAETNKTLHEKRVISDFDYLQSKINYQKAAKQLDAAKQEFLTAWQTEQTNLELKNNELQSSITQLRKELRQYALTAPTSGTLLQVAGYRQGNFIAPSQTLAYISANDSLLAECYVLPADIGYIKEGQTVNFQFDAFNYREWGMIKGTVKEMLGDVVLIDQKPMFRIRCNMLTQHLQLKNGYRGNVQKGMTYTARFMLNRRTLWQLLFDKLDNWLNPKIVTSNKA